MSSSKLLDLQHIRRCVPIFEIAEALDLRVSGNMAHCWRPENHQHGDRTPSVGLHKRRNFARCFVCDALTLSPIDLVMSVRGWDFKGALAWIASRYDIPAMPKGKHIEHSGRWTARFRLGTDLSSLGVLVRSGIWATLTPSQRSIIPVLETFTNSESQWATISYRGLMKYAGVRSQSTVAAALKRFRKLMFLKIVTGKDAEGFRTCNKYQLNFDDPEFLQLAKDCWQKHENEIRRERELRKEARQERKRRRALPVNTLSNGWSSAEVDALTNWSVK